MKTDIDIEKLRAALKDAFSAVPLPPSRLFMPYDKNEQAMITKFGRKHWSKINPYQLEISDQVLYLLRAEWFHFYLPAYLLSVLQSNAEEIINFNTRVHNLLGVLMPSENPTFQSRFEQRVALLSAEQRAAVALFVDYTIQHFPDRHDPAEGPSYHTILTAYWLADPQE